MRRVAGPLLLALCLAFFPGCRTQTQAGSKQELAHDAIRDLTLDEARGGHTLQRHVGRTDEELQQRLEHERNISAASSYSDRQTAERAVGIAIQDSRDKIQNWIARGSRRPNLVLDYTDPQDSLGRVMYRRSAGSVPCDHAIVVLKSGGVRDYYVLTSYPECRP